RNVWPTPMIRWTGDLSIEVAGVILVLAVATRWIRRSSRLALRALTGLWLFLVIGHYADVTAPALYGREVNLYWDLRFVPGVAGLLAQAGPRWLVGAAIAAVIVVLSLLYVLFRWALARLLTALASAPTRRVLMLTASAIVALFGVRAIGADVP